MKKQFYKEGNLISEKILKNGDIVNIDVTVIVDGWYGDTSRMFLVGDKVTIKILRGDKQDNLTATLQQLP